ncbi:glyoxalase superfamily protein [Pseudomonas sp. S1(2024)]|uniref:glyoxalase superfamily protein n=1 Tax=Pseudomonas sp. S1(2024) TaxID=3390191 RepID=UPI00397897E7
MNISQYKAMAKLRRTSIQAVLGVAVTHSQALEIVAREHNFPSWDALCGSQGRCPPSYPLKASVQVETAPLDQPEAEVRFRGHEQIIAHLGQRLQSGAKPSLIVISSAPSCSASATTRLVFEQLLKHQVGTDAPPAPTTNTGIDAWREALRCAMRADPDHVYFGHVQSQIVLTEVMKCVAQGRHVIINLTADDAYKAHQQLMALMRGNEAYRREVQQLIEHEALYFIHQGPCA